MTKLLVWVLALSILLAVSIAHYKGGDALLGAPELSARSAAEVLAILASHGLDVPGIGLAETPVSWLLRPGVYVLSRLGVPPENHVGIGVSAISGWWLFIAALRLAWCITGRSVGLYNVAQHWVWCLLLLPWRPPYRVWLRLHGWYRQLRYGRQATAAWTGLLAAMTLIFRPGDCVYLGRLWAFGIGLFQPLGIRGPRHIAVIAGTGSGKTRWLMTWLGTLHKKASAFVIDTDAQIVNSIGPALQSDGHKVCVLDPFRLSTFPGSCWNPLEEITRAVERHGIMAAVRFALQLAEALIREDNMHQQTFANGARQFVAGVILYVWLFEPPERRNLVRVRELIACGMPELVIDPTKQDPFHVCLLVMMRATRFDDGCGGKIMDLIARAASIIKSGQGREGNPFRTTALSQTSWIDIPEVAATLLRSDFAGEDLKTGNPCLFICAPVTDIQTRLSGWFRSLTMMTMYAFEAIPGGRAIPCAFCLDEMPSLGRIEILETAAPVFRRFGIRLVTICQDLERLRKAYRDSWNGFLSNTEARIFLGTDDPETLEYISKELGTRTYTERVEGGNWLSRLLGLSKVPPRYQKVERPLMYPHQVREFLDRDRRQMIVLRAGKPALRVKYDPFDRALPVWRYVQDPNFREPLLRALMRWFVSMFIAQYTPAPEDERREWERPSLPATPPVPTVAPAVSPTPKNKKEQNTTKPKKEPAVPGRR